MTVKIGINGFGRIGRLAFRRIAQLNSDKIKVVDDPLYHGKDNGR